MLYIEKPNRRDEIKRNPMATTYGGISITPEYLRFNPRRCFGSNALPHSGHVVSMVPVNKYPQVGQFKSSWLSMLAMETL